MQIRTSNISGLQIPYRSRLTRLLETVLLAEREGNVNLVFCSDEYIKQLNRKFLKRDRATDVLTFDYSEPDILGELYISAEMAKSQAPRWKNTFYRELRRLIVHGGLHLAGYDHSERADKKLMHLKEDFYLAQ